MRLAKLAVASLSPTVGAVRSNVTRAIEVANEMAAENVTIGAFPELVIGGYPPEDLVQWPGFLVGQRDELERFAALQAKLEPLARRVISDPRSSQTVVVVPSLTLDVEELAKIPGVHHYEERLLCMLMLLRLPRTHLVYVTSQHIATAIVDYYQHLLPGIPLRHARSRLTLLS